MWVKGRKGTFVRYLIENVSFFENGISCVRNFYCFSHSLNFLCFFVRSDNEIYDMKAIFSFSENFFMIFLSVTLSQLHLFMQSIKVSRINKKKENSWQIRATFLKFKIKMSVTKVHNLAISI